MMNFFNWKRAYIPFLLLAFIASCSPATTLKTTAQAPPATTQTSVHLTLGNPSKATTNPSNINNYLLVKPQYALSYNRTKGIPNWVSWQLNKNWLGDTPRRDSFRPDNTLPTGWYQVRPNDYSGSGYDRGHMTPSGDRTKTAEDNSSTFYMTNMVPQSADNNQGYWASLENYSRDLVEQGKELFIIAGNYGIKGKIAGGKVTVPSRIFKIIVVTNPGTGIKGITQSTRVIAIDTPNVQGNKTVSWRNFITSVDAIEKKTGWDFLSTVSPNIQAVIEAKIDKDLASSSPSQSQTRTSTPNNSTKTTNTTQPSNCDPSYPTLCIAPNSPDLDCKDIGERNFQVLSPDRHRLDGDKDGIGCESN